MLQSEARRPLDLAIRYGGEEFLIVWYALEPAEVLDNLVRRVHGRVATLRLPHQSSPIARTVTVSAGAVATIPGAQAGMDAFLEAADAALYEAKINGRNQVVTVSGFDNAQAGHPD